MTTPTIPAPKTAESRQFTRVPFTVEVSVASEHNFFTGFTSNISEGGVFIATDLPPPLGTIVEFELTLAPGKTKVKLKGEVCWIRERSINTLDVPPGMGLNFLDLHPRLAERITSFIDGSRDALFYDDDDDF